MSIESKTASVLSPKHSKRASVLSSKKKGTQNTFEYVSQLLAINPMELYDDGEKKNDPKIEFPKTCRPHRKTRNKNFS